MEMGASFYRDHHREYALSRLMDPETAFDGIRRFLERQGNSVWVGDLDEAAFLIRRGVSAIIRIAIEEHPEKLEKPAFREEWIDMLSRYLSGGS